MSSSTSKRYIRKVIHITAADSPNVRLASEQQRRGIPVTNQEIVPGVLSWREYQKRTATWDEILQTIGLHARFYEGAEVLMYPPHWLNRAHHIARERGNRLHPNNRRALGIDPGEGMANTAWAVVDDSGLLELISRKTPDTSEIIEQTLSIMRRWQVPPDRTVFDRGGGGKQHADTMRRMKTYDYPNGIRVRTVAFGESISLDPKRGLRPIDVRMDAKEDKYTYVNRRAEMYGELRILLDPSATFQDSLGKEVECSFAIPEHYSDLRLQLAPIPLLYDGEGRMRLPPKNRKSEAATKNGEKTLTEIIGRSPDEADALVLAVHGLLHKTIISVARGF